MAGFIERQRQANEVRERQAVQYNEARKRQKVEAARKGREEHERIKQLEEQAGRYLQESGIVRMADEVVTFYRWGKGEFSYRTEMNPSIPFGQGNVGFKLLWAKDHAYHEITDYIGFEIEGAPNGTIAIKGGFGGSTTLTRSQWRDKPDVVESALERAYYHSKKIRVQRGGSNIPNY